jgi:hypothetical protein
VKLEIKVDGRAFALAATFLFAAGGLYFGWQSLSSGLELRQQTAWIKAIAAGADPADLDIPAADRQGVLVMGQLAKTSGLSEDDWGKFDVEAQQQMRNGALYMAGSILLAALLVERTVRKSLQRRQLAIRSNAAGRVDPVGIDPVLSRSVTSADDQSDH